MKWSIKLGRIAGIDVYVHATFLALMAFVVGSYLMAGEPVAEAVEGTAFLLAVFGCVLVHEYGHALTARRFGIRTRDITLLPIGGVARLERMPDRPAQELWVALAGPAVNVVIASGLAVWILFTHAVGLAGLWEEIGESFAVRLLLVNVTLVLFNLIPAFPMDGGRVLRALLAMRMEYARATRIAARLGQVIACVFAFFGLLGIAGGMGNPMLLFIALFVWVGANQEASLAEMRSTFGGAQVRDAMMTRYEWLSPTESLQRAVELVMAGAQSDFPVLTEGRVVGVLTRRRLLSVLAQRGTAVSIGEAMEVDFVFADAAAPLEGFLRGHGGRPPSIVPVVESGRLVGLLTWDNLTDFVLIRAAMRGGPRSTAPGVPPVLGAAC